MKTYLKLPITLILTYFTYSYLIKNPYQDGLLYGINLGIHEFGHVFMMLVSKNSVLISLGGTIFQLLMPTVFLFYFLYKKNMFGVLFCFFWFSQNLVNVGVYMLDANLRVLPLLGGNVDGHDWHNIFSRLNLLSKAEIYGERTIGLGKFSMILSLILMYVEVFYRKIGVTLKR
ncbi:hypothetical protein ACFL0C_00370 [Patescibacteria group bacterium]